MKEETLYLNGEYFPHREAKISVFDSGLTRGDAMTESTRTFGHRPYRLEKHVQRLYKSLKVARYPLPMSPEDMLSVTREVIERNLPVYGADDDFWIVHNITRGRADFSNDPTKHSEPTVIIYTSHLDLSYWVGFYTTGCHAVTPFSRQTPSQSLDPKIKNRSRLAYTLCDLETKLVDPAAQCILLDTDGNLTENKGGNFFVVQEGMVETPTGRNILVGESRQTVIELCGELSIPCRERDLQPYDVYTADEAFFTSTPYCMMPATRFNGLPVGDGQVGPLTKRLLQGWSDRVGVDIVAQAQRQVSSGHR